MRTLPKIDIRYAELSDIPFIINGINQIVEIESGDIRLEESLNRTDRDKKAREDIPKKNILVATLRNNPIGFIWFTISNKCPYGVDYGDYTRKYLWVNFSFVSKENRNQGIATSLYKEVFKIASSKKIYSIALDVFEVNKNSLEFHEKLGFNSKIRLMFMEDLF